MSDGGRPRRIIRHRTSGSFYLQGWARRGGRAPPLDRHGRPDPLAPAPSFLPRLAAVSGSCRAREGQSTPGAPTRPRTAVDAHPHPPGPEGPSPRPGSSLHRDRRPPTGPGAARRGPPPWPKDGTEARASTPEGGVKPATAGVLPTAPRAGRDVPRPQMKRRACRKATGPRLTRSPSTFKNT